MYSKLASLSKGVKTLLLIISVILLCGVNILTSSLAERAVREKTLPVSIHGTLTIGESIPLSSLRGYKTAARYSPEWSAEYSDAAVFDPTEGIITGISAGKLSISASDRIGAVADIVIEVVPESSIKLSAEALTLGAGQSCSFGALSGNGAEVLLSSANPMIAQCEGDKLSALQSGETYIIASAYGCEQVSCRVKVLDAPTSLLLSNEALTLGEGDSAHLSVSVPEGSINTAPVYESSDTGVATVSPDGKITAVSRGTAAITASVYNGTSATCAVEVVSAPSRITLVASKKTSSLFAGQSLKLTAELPKGSASSMLSFSSGDERIATVSQDGTVTATGRGSTYITCTTYNGKTDKVKVTSRIVNFTKPFTSAKVYSTIGYLCSMYPELISSEKIGSSVMGRDILLVKLGKGEKKACIVSGLHAREDMTINFTLRCIEEYAQAYYSKSGNLGRYNIKSLLDKYTLYLVPMSNPDGTDIANDGVRPLYLAEGQSFDYKDYKSNANGVNLNRNFPFRWEHSTECSTVPDISTYPGASASSEPETAAIVSLVEANAFEFLFSMHVKGNFIYWADAVNKITTDDYNLSSRLEKYCGYGLKSISPEKNLGGGLENWFRYATGNPGFCIELIPPDYSTEPNEYFELKTVWNKTKLTFAAAMKYDFRN